VPPPPLPPPLHQRALVRVYRSATRATTSSEFDPGCFGGTCGSGGSPAGKPWLRLICWKASAVA
jgi:hypothetical protein